MLNENVQEQHAFYGIKPNPKYEGVPHPAVFLLNELGVVTDRRFHKSYRVRETGVGLLARVLNIATPPAVESDVTADRIRVRTWIDVPSYKPFQELQLHLQLDLAEGWLVYAQPTPPGFIPLRVEIDAVPGLEVGEASWPESELHRMAELDYDFFVYTNSITASMPITFSMHGSGQVSLRGQVHFQLCNDSECLLPGAVEWVVDIPEAPQTGKISGQ